MAPKAIYKAFYEVSMGSHGILYQIRQCHPPRQSTVSCSVFFAFVPSNRNFDHNPMIPCDKNLCDNTDPPNCFIYFILCYCLTSLPFRPQPHNTLVKAFFLTANSTEAANLYIKAGVFSQCLHIDLVIM